MIPQFRDYTAEIKPLKFISEGGHTYPATAMVRFRVADKDVPLMELMGHVSEEEVYARIDRGEPVMLDHCFVEKFSLKNYRLTRDLGPEDRVAVSGFSARNCLFQGQSPLDLSFADIGGEEFSMEGSWIIRGGINLESAHIKAHTAVFKGITVHEGGINCKNARFDSGLIDFKHGRFGKGEKNFQFMEVRQGEVLFTDADFSDGDVNFINTMFGTGGVSFKMSRFGSGKVDFHYASFPGGKVNFERASFGNGLVDFRIVEFGPCRVSFNRTAFGDGDVTFDEAQMESGKFNCKRARFGRGTVSLEELQFGNVDVYFDRTEFGEGNLVFYRSAFRELSLAYCQLNGYVDLRLGSCGRLNLNDTVVRDIIDLSPHGFRSEIGALTLLGMRLIGRIYFDWKQSGVKRLIYGQENSSYRQKAEQFRILKENYQGQGSYNDEDRAYVEFKRNESRADLEESVLREGWKAWWQYPLFWFKLFLFDKAGLYATSPVRVLANMVTVFLLFGLVYVLMMVYTESDIIASVDDQLPVMTRALYHSAITFLTIGYGDHYPYGGIRWVSAVEGFMGLFLMSYFTVAFVRKILR